MGGAEARPAAYGRRPDGERRRMKDVIEDGTASMRRLLPMGRGRFEALLAAALADAARHGTGFYLGGFAARRALGRGLVIDIDPAVLQRRLDHGVRLAERSCNIRDKFLGAGDWTPLLRVLRRSSSHREVSEIVAAGFDYRQTPSYRTSLDRASGDNPVKRNHVVLSSPGKVEAYFRHTAELCRSIGESGLLRRSDYGTRLASLARPSVRLPWIEFGEVDIGVAVGAAGEVYRFASGKHRTAAAQVLQIRSMPVEIRMVHADWLVRQMEDTGLAPAAALRRGIETLRRG
jgi:hypothetical protein